MSSAIETTASAKNQIALAPQISATWALSARHVALAALFGAFFLVWNYIPLRPTDLWCHVAYGDWILQHGELPDADPFLPLAEGMPVVDFAWLSQVALAAVARAGGDRWLSNLFAISMLCALLVLARTFFLQTGRLWIAMLGVGLVLVVGWSRLGTIRPEMFGILCFAILLWMLSRPGEAKGKDERARTNSCERHTWRLRMSISLLFALWANLHGSFVCGLVVLGCYLAGAAAEVLWRTRSIRATWRHPAVRDWLILVELALLATMLNPYGLDLVVRAVGFASVANLTDVQEWQPWSIANTGGAEFALSLLALVVVLRRSQRLLPAAHGLMLLIFAAATLSGIRMLSWYAPVFAFVMMPHLASLFLQTDRLTASRRRQRPREHAAAFDSPLNESAESAPPDESDAPQPLTASAFRTTLLTCLVAWIAFALSPIATPLLGGQTRTPEQLYGEETPVALAEYLREHPPQGVIFNPQWWGDWLLWAGPEGLQPFVTSNIHVAPARVWQDYMAVAQSTSGWQSVLDRYRIDTVVFDKRRQREQAGSLRRSEDWLLVYEDRQAIVFRRAEL